MRMLIDTNVILDIIFNRKNCNVSTELFRKMGKLGIDACITSILVYIFIAVSSQCIADS